MLPFLNHPLVRTMRPYITLMRLDRPVGAWLLMWPALWALAMQLYIQPSPDIGTSDVATPDVVTPNVATIIITSLICIFGAFVTRSAGCVANDLWDKQIDANVSRTMHRPLASGEIQPWQAWILLIILSFIALGLALLLPKPVLTPAVAAAIMIILYPSMKRVFIWPQLWLGVTYSMSILIALAAMEAPLSLAYLWLFLANVAWVTGYDTIYALQDKDDDATLNIHSTALWAGSKVRLFVIICYMLCAKLMVDAWLMMGIDSWAAWLGIAAFSLHLGWQIYAMHHVPKAGKIFASNIYAGSLPLIGLWAGYITAW